MFDLADWLLNFVFDPRRTVMGHSKSSRRLQPQEIKDKQRDCVWWLQPSPYRPDPMNNAECCEWSALAWPDADAQATRSTVQHRVRRTRRIYDNCDRVTKSVFGKIL
jgi:hypothetical protein